MKRISEIPPELLVERTCAVRVFIESLLLPLAELRIRNGDWLRPRCLSPFRIRPGTPRRVLGAIRWLRSPLVLIFRIGISHRCLVIRNGDCLRPRCLSPFRLKTPHPNPLPGVPGRGDKTFPPVNFVSIDQLYGVWFCWSFVFNQASTTPHPSLDPQGLSDFTNKRP